MKKVVKTEAVLKVYNIISSAKYGKMSDDDKIKIWKISRILKPIASKFEEDSKDAYEKFIPNEEFKNNLQKAQEYERTTDKEQFKEMTETQYRAFIKEYKDYNKIVEKAIREFADKEVEIEFTLLSEESFGKLMASNDWNMEQVTTLGDFICE